MKVFRRKHARSKAACLGFFALPFFSVSGVAQTSYKFTHFPDWFIRNPYTDESVYQDATAAIVLDYDHDGFIDLIMGSRIASLASGQGPSPKGRWLYFLHFKGEGGGKFYYDSARKAPLLNIAVEKSYIYQMAGGDFDGDGDVDIFAGRSIPPFANRFYTFEKPAPDRLFLNNGKGDFTYAPSGSLPANNFITADCRAVDIDGDGDLDILTGVVGGLNRIYINNGKGVFSDESTKRFPTSPSLNRYDTSQIVIGDVDRDGDPDLFWATGGWLSYWSQQNDLLLLNDGKGRFKLSVQPDFKQRNTGGGAFADFDGDGDLDLVTASQKEPSRLYLNDGKGVFKDVTATRFPNPKEEHYWVLAVDVDEDGDKDILSGGRCPFRVFLNDGKGYFKEAPAAPDATTWGYCFKAVAADLDRDGDMDILQLPHNPWLAPLRIYYNLQRQFYVSSKRFALGRSARFEVYADRPPAWGAIFLSMRPGKLRFPGFGTWYLDAATSVPLFPFAIGRSQGGKYAVSIHVPNDSRLAKKRVYCQGLLFNLQTGSMQFTNFTTNPIKYYWQK